MSKRPPPTPDRHAPQPYPSQRLAFYILTTRLFRRAKCDRDRDCNLQRTALRGFFLSLAGVYS